jgi:hypothetical protein
MAVPAAAAALSSTTAHEATTAARVTAADPYSIATEARHVCNILAAAGVEILSNIHPAQLACAKANITPVLKAHRPLRDVHLPANAWILNPAGGPLPQMSKISRLNSILFVFPFFFFAETRNAFHMLACVCFWSRIHQEYFDSVSLFRMATPSLWSPSHVSQCGGRRSSANNFLQRC